MPPEVFDLALDWIATFSTPQANLDVTFHGGEPLLAGHAWYRRNLPLLRSRLGDRLKLRIQSNLWLLDDEYCELFREYRVAIGTSLDGPEAINDRQRGAGYFRRTLAGIQLCRQYGAAPGVICTFTPLSAPYFRDVFEFFASQGLQFSIHAASCAFGTSGQADLTLTPRETGDLFVELFDYYLANITRVQIPTFDSMARGISSGLGGICVFTDCLGDYLTVAPDGGIFPCNRFAHDSRWRLGWVQEQPRAQDITRATAWCNLTEREQAVREQCGSCLHFGYCRGGCAYLAASSDESAQASAADKVRDPYCAAYRRVFRHIADYAVAQVFAEENWALVVEKGGEASGCLKKGQLLQIMRGDRHHALSAQQNVMTKGENQ